MFTPQLLDVFEVRFTESNSDYKTTFFLSHVNYGDTDRRGDAEPNLLAKQVSVLCERSAKI
jgi:hypothetical protein